MTRANASESKPSAFPAQSRRRVVLLGASNLTRSFSTVVALLRLMWGPQLEIMAAMGHGRSYGKTTRVLVRELPGIVDCGIWRAIERAPRTECVALVTDIGNDVVYGASTCEIAEWIDQCLTRLEAANATAAVTLLPIENLLALERLRYYLFRNLHYPACRLSLQDACGRASELNELIRGLAQRRGVAAITQRRDWYGLDPIHIRFGARWRAWREILSVWLDQRDRLAMLRRRPTPLQGLRPERRTMFGREQFHDQPCRTLPGGTSIALY